MQNKAESVVDCAIVEHGLVATLVSQNPDTNKDESLEHAVESIQGASQRERRYILDLGSHVEHGRNEGDVSHDVAHGGGRRLVEAVLGDGGSQSVN